MSTLRLYVQDPLVEGATLTLPDGAARHVQVWRLQPGDPLRVFDGRGGERHGVVASMRRQSVTVTLGPAAPPAPESAVAVTLAVGMPANERMDTLVEKATELGVVGIQPLHCERSVLRLSGERATRKREHWQAVAAAASAQSGRAVVPAIEPVQTLSAFLATLDVPSGSGPRLLLSLQPDAAPLREVAAAAPGAAAAGPWVVLCGPEGGLSAAEMATAQAAGFVAASLGPRVLRADTAPLAALAWLVMQS